MTTTAFEKMLVALPGLACFLAFGWGLRGHFRSTGAMPVGMRLVTAASAAGFGWFGWRLLSEPLSRIWELALVLFCGAMALFGWAVQASRRQRLTLAFDDDAPSFLLHDGPYRYIRHPFYSAYLMFWTGTSVATPGLVCWSAMLAMLALYTVAARKEEAKFGRSSLAVAYAAYRAVTGRFVPRLPGVAAISWPAGGQRG